MLFVRNCGGGWEINVKEKKERLINYEFSNYLCEIQQLLNNKRNPFHWTLKLHLQLFLSVVRKKVF